MNEEFNLDFDLDEIDIGIEVDEEINQDLPPVYLLLENLVMLEQVKGFVDENPDLITVPAYAYKGEELKLVGIVELTTDNVLSMQLLGLKVTLVRQGKDSIYFDKADDYVAIIKTLKAGDTIDITDSDLPSDSVGEQEG